MRAGGGGWGPREPLSGNAECEAVALGGASRKLYGAYRAGKKADGGGKALLAPFAAFCSQLPESATFSVIGGIAKQSV